MNMTASPVTYVLNDADPWSENGGICSAGSTKGSRILLLSYTVRRVLVDLAFSLTSDGFVEFQDIPSNCFKLSRVQPLWLLDR